MTIMLKKDGQLIIDPTAPIEGKNADLDNLAAFIADPADGDAIVYDATAGIWKVGKVSGGGSGGGSAFVIHASDAEQPALDKTWQEIKNAFEDGSVVIALTADGDVTYLASIPAQYGNDTFVVSFIISGTTDTNVYTASSANGYPTAPSA